MTMTSKPGIDLAGQRFGRLVAKSWAAGKDKKWVCLCDCGRSVEVRGAGLRAGRAKSCGCLKAEKMAAGLGTKHSMSETATYSSWGSMLGRCTQPNDPSYERYGAIGVTVCERWSVFENFLADMGERPAETSLDRIDPRGNYEPDNCRWASAKVQANNRRNNRKVEFHGQAITIRELSDATGAPYELLRERILKAGWSVERALSAPKARLP